MNDTDKKMLTEWMGKCWHSPYLTADGRCDICNKKVTFSELIHRRTFTTWQDLGDVKDKLVEKGLWQQFYKVVKDGLYKRYGEGMLNFDAFTSSWLFRPVNEEGEPHFCGLVEEFLEGRK